MPPAAKSRRARSASGAVDDLKTMVNSLIKENQKLKRQLTRLEAKSIEGGADSATRALGSIARRVERALGPASSRVRPGRRTSTAARRSGSGTATRPRKPASPETQAKRLAALARARDARAAKRTAAS
jgi:hypothetical protein